MRLSMIARIGLAALALLLVTTGVVWAKTTLTRVVIEGPGLASPLEISDWWELELFGTAMRENEPIGAPAPEPHGAGYTVTVYRWSSVCCVRNEREMGTFHYSLGSSHERGYVKNSPYHRCDAAECWERASRYLDSWMASHVKFPAPASAASPYLVYVATANHEVLVVDPESGNVTRRIPIGATYRPRWSPRGESPAGRERPLALNLSGDRLYVLDHDPDSDGDLRNSVGFHVIDPTLRKIEATFAVPTTESFFWTNLTVTPVGDRVYLLGNRLVDVPNNLWELMILEMDTLTGEMIRDYSLYPAGTVFQAAIDSAGRHLYIAYHGASSGVDVLTPSANRFFARDEERPTEGRILAHGGVVRGPDGRMYTPTDGGAMLLAVAPGYIEALDTPRTGLGDSTHMPEMEASPTDDVLYLLGGCTAIEESKKLYMLNVRSGDFHALAEGTVCGHRLAMSPDGRFLAVLRDQSVSRQSNLLIVDAQSGEIHHEFPLDAAGLDLIAVPLAPTSLPVTGEEASPAVGTLLLMGAALVTLGALVSRLQRGSAA